MALVLRNDRNSIFNTSKSFFMLSETAVLVSSQYTSVAFSIRS